MKKFILPCILILAFTVRLFSLSTTPPSLNWDEASLGYNAFAILHSGRDEWGKTLPLIFRAFGDYKLPGYVYLSVPFIFVFGLTEVSIRLLSVFSGVGIVFFTYVLVVELGFLDKKAKKIFISNHVNTLALLASLIVSFAPWTLFLSRVAVEANFATFLVLCGVSIFLHGVRKQKAIFFFLGLLSLSLSMWTYNSMRIFVPLFSVSLFYFLRSFLRSSFRQKSFWFSVIIFLVISLGAVFQLISLRGAQSRYDTLQLLDQGAILRIIDLRNTQPLPFGVSRFVYNRPVYFVWLFFLNYVKYFSPQFLFLTGGTQWQFNLPNYGQLYFVDSIPFIIGIIFLLKNLRTVSSKLLLSWLFLGFIPASLTRDAPHALRSFAVTPVPMIIIATGIVWLTLKYKFLLKVYFVLFVCSVCGFLYLYFGSYRVTYSQSWQYGYRDIVAFVRSHYSSYDKIFVTKRYGEPHIFFLYYFQWDPSSYREDLSLIRYEQSNWFWVDSFDKFVFLNDWDIPDTGSTFVTERKVQYDCKGTCLLITSRPRTDVTWKEVSKVSFLDSSPAFWIYEH